MVWWVVVGLLLCEAKADEAGYGSIVAETGTLVVSSADSMVILGVGSEYSVQIADDVLS